MTECRVGRRGRASMRGLGRARGGARSSRRETTRSARAFRATEPFRRDGAWGGDASRWSRAVVPDARVIRVIGNRRASMKRAVVYDHDLMRYARCARERGVSRAVLRERGVPWASELGIEADGFRAEE